MKTLYREELDGCDICKTSGDKLDVLYDMPVQGTCWANVCQACKDKHSLPDSPLGFKIVKGKHPNADPERPQPLPFTMEAVLADKAHRQKEQDHANALELDELQEMMFDGVVEAADGCSVEPDGQCPHGYRSPLRVLGIM